MYCVAAQPRPRSPVRRPRRRWWTTRGCRISTARTPATPRRAPRRSTSSASACCRRSRRRCATRHPSTTTAVPHCGLPGILGVAAEPALPEVAASLTDPELTADAAAALSFMGPKAFEPLRQAVNHPEVIVRRESLRSIGKLRFRAPLASADVLPLLLDAMPDTDPTVRTVAATYLGILHDDAAVVGAAADGGARGSGSGGAPCLGYRARGFRQRRRACAAGFEEGGGRSGPGPCARGGPGDRRDQWKVSFQLSAIRGCSALRPSADRFAHDHRTPT